MPPPEAEAAAPPSRGVRAHAGLRRDRPSARRSSDDSNVADAIAETATGEVPSPASESATTQRVPVVAADPAAPPRRRASPPIPPTPRKCPSPGPPNLPRPTRRKSPDAGDTAALSIADLEEALREARERQHALVEEAALENTDTGRVSAIQSETVDLGTSVRRPKVDMPSGTKPKDFKAIRREIAYRISVRVPQGETRVTLLREGRHVLGRSEACRVVVPHPSVSREHAEIDVGPQGVRIRDLGSSNGTFRGGKRIGDLVIKAGETLAFGDAEATFEEIETAPAHSSGFVSTAATWRNRCRSHATTARRR